MMNLRFSSFIVINDDALLDASRHDRGKRVRGKYQWSENGTVMYPLEIAIPLIDSKARKCVGLGIVRNINIDADKTTIRFDIEPLDATTSKAYYNLYMQFKSMERPESSYDSDVFIPGAMGLGKELRGGSDRRRDDDDDDLGSLSITERMARMGYQDY